MGLRAAGFPKGYGFFSKRTSLTGVLRHPATGLHAPRKRLTTKPTVLTAAVMARAPAFRAKSPGQLRPNVRYLFREGLSQSPRGRTGRVRDFNGHGMGRAEQGEKGEKRLFPHVVKRG
jgi:hypothetical protein